MKKITVQLATAAFALIFVGCAAAAKDDTTPPAQSHEEHHPEGEPAKEKPHNGMMGMMNMEGMMGMMQNCMQIHKDGKMCDHEMMEKCQGQMSKGECQKMMKQAKAQEKSNAKEKTKK